FHISPRSSAIHLSVAASVVTPSAAAGAIQVASSGPCSRSTGPSSATIVSAASTPNTSPSSSELLANRLAPCTPVQATSPAAYNPRSDVLPWTSVLTPPIR